MKAAAAKGHTSKHAVKHHKHKAHHHTAKHHPAASGHTSHITHHKAKVHTKAKHATHGKARGLSMGDVQCCAAEALAASLRLSGVPVSDADILALYWHTADDPDAGASIEATLEAAWRFGLGGVLPIAVDHASYLLDAEPRITHLDGAIFGNWRHETRDAGLQYDRQAEYLLSQHASFSALNVAKGLRVPGLKTLEAHTGYDVGLADPEATSCGPDIPCEYIGVSGHALNSCTMQLVLGIDLPGPHTVLATPDGWWSWGEPWCPCEFPDAVVEEAWAVEWAVAA